MSKIFRTFTTVILGTLLVLSNNSFVAALSISTEETNFLREPILQISAYGWQRENPELPLGQTNPNVLQYVEFYNDGDELINLGDWSLWLQNELGERSLLPMGTDRAGMIEPHKHTIASYDEVVVGATFSLTRTALPIMSQTIKPKLVLVSAGYRESIYELKATADFWQRNLSSTGVGYVSTFTGLTKAPEVLIDDGLYLAPTDAPEGVKVVEIYPYSSDCTPTDESKLCRDYIKIHVDNIAADLSQYVLRTSSGAVSRTVSNTLYLGDYTPTTDGFLTISASSEGLPISLTNDGGYVWIEDLYGIKTYNSTMSEYPAFGSTKQGYAWAADEAGKWDWTTTPQPDLPNKLTAIVPEVVICPDGKYLNPETGRCRTIAEAVSALAACPEGQERNPLTNRCRSTIVKTTSTILTPCAEGQVRNPLTNRCRSVLSEAAELIPCDEGYERNPETNRCRKVLGAAIGSANNPAALTQSTNLDSTKSADVWVWALVAAGILGVVGYGFYEWRRELSKIVARFVERLRKK